eukprot:171674-Amphidinium_carterae.1
MEKVKPCKPELCYAGQRSFNESTRSHASVQMLVASLIGACPPKILQDACNPNAAADKFADGSPTKKHGTAHASSQGAKLFKEQAKLPRDSKLSDCVVVEVG